MQELNYTTLYWSAANNISATAVDSLLHSQKAFFQKAESGNLANSSLASECPTSLHTLHKKLGVDQEDFRKYIVCPKCYKLYTHDQLVWKDRHGNTRAKVCDFSQYPHDQESS